MPLELINWSILLSISLNMMINFNTFCPVGIVLFPLLSLGDSIMLGMFMFD